MMEKAMKSMKIAKAEMPLSTSDAMVQGGPEYPYGLRLSLGTAVLKKLNLIKLPEVGEQMALHAIVEVVGVNASPSQNGGRDINVDLQVTDMCLESKESKAQENYGPDEDDTILGS